MAIERAVIDKRRSDSIVSGHGYRVQHTHVSFDARTFGRPMYQENVCSPPGLDLSNGTRYMNRSGLDPVPYSQGNLEFYLSLSFVDHGA